MPEAFEVWAAILIGLVVISISLSAIFIWVGTKFAKMNHSRRALITALVASAPTYYILYQFR
jgi:uncharacterized membrane protein YkgB